MKEVGTRISNEISNHQKTTGQKLTIEEIKDIPASKRTASEQTIIDLYEDIDGVYRAEWDLIDKSRAFNVDTALVESYNSQLSVIGSDYAIMLADCRAYSNSLITLTTGKETIVKALLISHYDDFIDGINRYGINYAELAIDYGEQFVNAISTYPQYADDIINITQKRQNGFLQTLNSLPEDKAITYLYHTKLDVYRLEVSTKYNKVAIAFVRDKQISGMAACGIITKNDTILSELEYKFYQENYDDCIKKSTLRRDIRNFIKNSLLMNIYINYLMSIMSL